MNAYEALLKELEKSNLRFSVALKMARICIFEVDLTRQLYTFFENSEAIFGVTGEKILRDVQPYSRLSPEEYQKAVSLYFSHPDDSEVISAAFSSVLSGRPASYIARMKAGETQFIWCKIDVTPIMENNVPVRMIGTVTDMNQIKAQIDDLQKQAHYDSLTGLYLKKYAKDQIQTILREQPQQRHALLLIDLDNFKYINDTYGHLTGDRVLKATGDTLKRLFRNSDVLGRFGGDEFVVFLRNIDGRKEFLPKVESFLRSADKDFAVTKSIGISVFPNDGATYRALFEAADTALYKAKKTRNAYALFSVL